VANLLTEGVGVAYVGNAGCWGAEAESEEEKDTRLEHDNVT
jgi:hypothetical protein